MLFLLLSFHAMWLFLTLVMGLDYFFPMSLMDMGSLGLVAVLWVVLFELFFRSRPGERFFYRLLGARTLIETEHQFVSSIILSIQQTIQLVHQLPARSVNIILANDLFPRAFSLGKQTIVLSEGLYETASSEVLSAVITHELYHIHQQKSVRMGIAVGVSIIISLTIFLISSFLALTVLWYQGGEGALTLSAHWFLLGTLIGSMMVLCFFQFNANLARLSTLFIPEHQEYTADTFAVKAGFGEGLLAFLKQNETLAYLSTGNLWSQLSTVPSLLASRILKIERLFHSSSFLS